MRQGLLTTILYLIPSIFFGQAATSTLAAGLYAPSINTINYKLGEDYVSIKVYQYGENKDYFFINLHDDEATAVKGAMKILESKGGTLVRIENARQRNIQFRMQGMTFTFDPNRIFSRDGIYRTLGNFGWRTDRAMNEVSKFAEKIISLLPPPPFCIIALHNNSNGKFSITSFLGGNARRKDAKEVHVGTSQDVDDLFLTTDSLLFRKLSKERFNAVLQDNRNAFKDGSLSIYCGENNLHYLNCETEHGRLKQYTEMLSVATRHMKKEEPVTVYQYRLSPMKDSVGLAKAYDIYFGEKKIGGIQPGAADRADRAMGKMEIVKNFTLYDNMDFYYFPVRDDSHKVEMRIDPTRGRKLVAEGEVVPIRVMP